MNADGTIYIDPIKTIENFQKKFLTAVDECVMIIVPLQEGSFFAPENQGIKQTAEGGLALFQVA